MLEPPRSMEECVQRRPPCGVCQVRDLCRAHTTVTFAQHGITLSLGARVVMELIEDVHTMPPSLAWLAAKWATVALIAVFLWIYQRAWNRRHAHGLVAATDQGIKAAARELETKLRERLASAH
jgi:hypothetical protein